MTLLLAAQSPTQRIFRPEDYGAKGDGSTNDTVALALLAEAVNANSGGIVEFRQATYLVGAQRPGDQEAGSFTPLPILHFQNCRFTLQVRGNGARMVCAPGLRFGTFDRSGNPTRHTQPYYNATEVAAPYRAMIIAEECVGGVLIQDLELDGKSYEQSIGGGYGDIGWQIPASGIILANNRGDEIVRNVYSHHHLLDGLIIDGIEMDQRPGSTRLISALRSEHNGRQGCSIVGGSDYFFRDCRFAETGRGALVSAPGAGVDIEAEGDKRIRRLTFESCVFAANMGPGLLAESGDSADATFRNCRFVGIHSWAAWPRKPGFRFESCQFIGSIVNAYGALTGAALFHGCTFRDDPALANAGSVYLGRTDGPIADLSSAQNVRFEQCDFRLTHEAVLPWSTGAIYADCRMRQASSVTAYPRGQYFGHTGIEGSVDLNGSTIEGEVVVNGVRLSRRQI